MILFNIMSMEWFTFLVSFTLVFLGIAHFNEWPLSKMWFLVFLYLIPLAVMLLEKAPGWVKAYSTRFNLVLYYFKKLRKAEMKNELLKSELQALEHELKGLQQIWLSEREAGVMAAEQTKGPRKIKHYNLTAEQKQTKIDSILKNLRMQKIDILEDESFNILTDDSVKHRIESSTAHLEGEVKTD